MKHGILIPALLLLSLAACKKDHIAVPDTNTTNRVTGNNTPVTGTRRELTLDSIFLYAKQVYYWNDALPSYEVFNPRKYTSSSNYAAYQQELFDLTQYAINQATGKPYEFVATANGNNAGYSKYSYITTLSYRNPQVYVPQLEGAVDLEGNGSDLGLAFASIGNASAYEVRIKYVNPSSPAHRAGLSRGDLVTRVNNTILGSSYDNDQNIIGNAVNGSSLRIAGTKGNGDAFDLTIVRANYKSSPIYRDTTITVDGKKIGYIAYSRFTDLSNSESALNAAFARFSAAGVSDLVVDLRYNGGGYVSTAEHLTNLIAPSSLTGRTMFREKFNALMQSGGATILKNQPVTDADGDIVWSNGRMLTYADYSYTESDNTYNFQKEGSLNGIQKVIFITTPSTASASEMVINNLRPHMNVKIVGKTSYGKPVGFFPLVLENSYEVYYSMFTSINSAGQTDYFAGFTPDWDVADDITRNFGDPKEACFAAAINYITRNSFVSANGLATVLSVKGNTISSTSKNIETRDLHEDRSFRGMVENRLKLK